MKKFLLILVIFLISVISISAQTVIGKEIRYRDVEWADFTGEIDTTSKYDAYTDWKTTYSFPAPKIFGDKVRVTLAVRLYLTIASWVKPNKKSARLLNHERGHFKIGRLCADELEKTINSMEFSRNNYHKEINEKYWEIIKKHQEMNRQYDKDTNHYNNQDQQEIWDKKLNDQLNQ